MAIVNHISSSHLYNSGIGECWCLLFKGDDTEDKEIHCSRPPRVASHHAHLDESFLSGCVVRYLSHSIKIVTCSHETGCRGRGPHYKFLKPVLMTRLCTPSRVPSQKKSSLSSFSYCSCAHISFSTDSKTIL